MGVGEPASSSGVSDGTRRRRRGAQASVYVCSVLSMRGGGGSEGGVELSSRVQSNANNSSKRLSCLGSASPPGTSETGLQNVGKIKAMSAVQSTRNEDCALEV